MSKLTTYKIRIKEFIFYDSPYFKFILAWGGICAAKLLLILKKEGLAFSILGTAHRAKLSNSASTYIERLMHDVIHASGNTDSASRLKQLISNYPYDMSVAGNLTRYTEDPKKLLRGNILVLKSPNTNEKGVLYLYYSYIYPLFLRLFDVKEIEESYHIVVEPSWTGYCDLNLLCLTTLKHDVVVGSIEPYDSNFIKNIESNLTTAEFSGNTWVDPNKFHPLDNCDKEYDVIYIASWGTYKRHWAFFQALNKLKQQGKILKVVLVGYSIDLTSKDIQALANECGVLDQITIFENINAEKVNELLNKSKINLLWSRREGVNRAIIEGMAANVPCVVRAGFNYGHNYHYINEKTGQFADEQSLPLVLMEMLDNLARFSPRAYVVDKMTPEVSTQTINKKLKEVSNRQGQNWTQDIVVRESTLGGLTYKDSNDWQRFENDYVYLESKIKRA